MSKSAKVKRIFYWVFTIWMCLGMTSTGIIQLIGTEEELETIDRLGYPAYLLTLLGICKLLGIVAVLAPRLRVLKEWAYAGFVFNTVGALVSHLASGSTVAQIIPCILLLSLTFLSWFLRPSNRKISTQTPDIITP